MAYGIKYRFRFWSEHGVLHTVNLLQDGYSGTVTERPLGKAPVIRMQDNGTFRSTSCNLTLECQVDGEFADLYTSDPREFRIDVFRGGTLSAGGELVWQGFVATEIYAEPDIAPPYDVDITATDGLGVLKEYDFEAQGLQKVRDLFKYFLNKTGIDNATINIATTTTPVPVTSAAMFDSTSINMDYMVGENCYDVFDELLRSLHLTVTQFKGNWLLIHETDVENMTTSSGGLSTYQLPTRSNSSTTTTTIADVKKTIGQMGVADVWPVGYLTRRVVPAKKEVTIEAPWHKMNVCPSVKDDGWDKNAHVTYVAAPGYYKMGDMTGAGVYNTGDIYSSLIFNSFQADLKVTIKYNRSDGVWGAVGTGQRRIRIRAIWETSGGTMYHYKTNEGWVEGTQIVYAGEMNVDNSAVNSGHDPALAMEADFSIPAFGGTGSGDFTIVICGDGVDIYEASLDVALCAGYKDVLVLNNGARGKDDTHKISGGRAINGYLNATAFYGGLFVSSSSPDTAIYTWGDNRTSGVNFVSLMALDYALSVAAPRINLSGRFDMPSGLLYPPLVLSLRNVLHQLATYEWDLLNDEVSFTAVSTPAASVTVTSETVISIPNE